MIELEYNILRFLIPAVLAITSFGFAFYAGYLLGKIHEAEKIKRLDK